MKLLPFLMLSALALTPSLALAEDEQNYVVTGSRFATPMNQIGYNVTVFTEEELQEKQLTTLDEVLRLVPGVTIAQNGVGGSTSLFARGGKSTEFLILIDGVAINDPSSTSGVDFVTVMIGTAERVEVALGAQSAMYGAGAMSGVINIITKEGNGPANGSIYIEGGYPLNGKFQASINGSNDKLSYSLGVSGKYADMASSTTEKSSYYNEDTDRFYDLNLNTSLKYTFSDMLNIRFTLNETYVDSNYDNGPELENGEDPTNGTSLRSFVSLKPELILFDGFWTQSLNLSYINTQRDIYSYYSGWGESNYKSQGMRADWEHKLALDSQNIALGLAYLYDQQIENPFYTYYTTEEKIAYYDIAGYAEYSVNPIDNLYINIAGRADKYDLFELGLSASAALAYTLPSNTTFNISGGRAFSTPTLQQMTHVNTKELGPETTISFDVSLEQPIGDIANISLGYYNAIYTDLIAFNSADDLYYNTSDKRTSQGLTAGIKATPISALSLSLSGNYEMTDSGDGSRQNRVPDYTATFDADYTLPIGNNAKVGFTVSHVGDRDDYDWGTYSDVTLDPYTLVNLRAQADVMDNLTLYLKLNNILNTEYEECYGYSTLGFNGNIGVKYTF